MKIYGSYTDADLDHWQSLPMNSHVLTQSAFGAWLLRRDVNKAKQFPRVSLTKVKQAREKIRKLDDINPDYPMDRTIHVSRNEVLEILDKLIEGVEDDSN